MFHDELRNKTPPPMSIQGTDRVFMRHERHFLRLPQAAGLDASKDFTKNRVGRRPGGLARIGHDDLVVQKGHLGEKVPK